jgi:hypothetical protein
MVPLASTMVGRSRPDVGRLIPPLAGLPYPILKEVVLILRLKKIF